MKKLCSFTLVILSVFTASLSFAAELVGYSTLQPANEYKILNVKGEVIFTATADTVKEVALRDGYAVVQSSVNSVSLLDETGKVIVKDAYGSKYLVSSTLLAVYNPGSIASVFDHSGKRLFAGTQIKSIGVAKSRFAVTDQRTGTTTVYGLNGEVLFAQQNVDHSFLSENFFVTLNTSGTLQVKNAAGSVLATDSSTHDVKVSNAFAGYLTAEGALRVFNAKGQILLLNNVADFGVSDSMIWVRDLFGVSIYRLDGSLMFTTANVANFAVSHDLVAVQTKAKTLTVLNTLTESRFSMNVASNFTLTDQLILIKNGVGQISVYSAKGTHLFDELSSSLVSVAISNSQVALQYQGLRTAKVVNLLNETAASTVLNEVQVDRLNLSLNRDELNWAAF